MPDSQATGGRTLFELRVFQFGNDESKARYASWLDADYLPTLRNAGVGPLGAFDPGADALQLYLLLPHEAFAAFASAQHIGADPAADLAIGEQPTSEASSLLLGFGSMPHLEIPVSGAGRMFQLRIYESPSATAARKKVEMFETAELAIFRRVGLNPVFFASALSGPNRPNLTYMLGFEGEDAQRSAWGAFVSDPEWKALVGQPEYSDAVLIRKITNITLRPLPSSDI